MINLLFSLMAVWNPDSLSIAPKIIPNNSIAVVVNVPENKPIKVIKEIKYNNLKLRKQMYKDEAGSAYTHIWDHTYFTYGKYQMCNTWWVKFLGHRVIPGVQSTYVPEHVQDSVVLLLYDYYKEVIAQEMGVPFDSVINNTYHGLYLTETGAKEAMHFYPQGFFKWLKTGRDWCLYGGHCITKQVKDYQIEKNIDTTYIEVYPIRQEIRYISGLHRTDKEVEELPIRSVGYRNNWAIMDKRRRFTRGYKSLRR